MQKAKKLILIFTVFLFLFPLFSQEAEAESAATTDIAEAQPDTENTKDSFPGDFVMQFEPGGYINPESSLVSAPSPIIYPISIGFLWPNHAKFAIQPVISFFMINHLYYENKALPAEIENRTTTTLSFMLTIPVVFSIYLEKSCFQFTGGPGIFMRFGILSPGVSENASGWTGSAGSDAAAINKWFWSNMRWLYLSIGASWLYTLTPKLRAGPVINFSIPVGGLISDHTAQGMLISAGIKICR